MRAEPRLQARTSSPPFPAIAGDGSSNLQRSERDLFTGALATTLEVPPLRQALQRVQGLVEVKEKTKPPILANVLIQSAGHDNVEISATDSETRLTTSCAAKISQPGAITIEGKLLYEIATSAPGPTISLACSEDNQTVISSATVRYRILSVPARDFPLLPRFESVSSFRFDPVVFREMIDKTIYAVSIDNDRPAFSGIYCYPALATSSLRMAATDGHRLSLIERSVGDAWMMERGILIPRKGALELRSLLENCDGFSSFGLVDDHLIYEVEDINLAIRLRDEAVPYFTRFVPEDSPIRLSLSREGLLLALQRASLVFPSKVASVELVLQSGSLTLIGRDSDFGEVREDLAVRYAGPGLLIGFNCRYLVETLLAMDEDEIELHLRDQLSAAVIRGVRDPDFSAVIMPMRIQCAQDPPEES